MSDLINRSDAVDALVEKGQRSRRYKLGDIWELNGNEIREALGDVPSAEPEIIHCKDCTKQNKRIGIDENFNVVWKEDACPLVSWRGKAQGHEFDYQYCVYGERKDDDK